MTRTRTYVYAPLWYPMKDITTVVAHNIGAEGDGKKEFSNPIGGQEQRILYRQGELTQVCAF